MAGNHAAIGILAALRHRDATGEGQLVEVNLLSSALSGLVNHSSAYVAGGVVPYRMGNAHPSVFPYEPLPTADNDLIVAAANDGQFRKLCEVLGIPEVADDPRFARNADRTANREQLRPLLVEQLATRGAEGVVRAAGRGRGAVRTDQHHRRRVRHGRALRAGPGRRPSATGERAVPTTRNPIRFSATPARYRLPPPELDEHGAELRKWLVRAHAEEPDGVAELSRDYPTALGASDPKTHHAARPRPGRGRDGQGRVRRAGLLAGHPAPPGARARCGCSRRCWPRWPTTASRPTAIVTRLTYLSAPDSVQGALAAGLLGGGSRFLGVTEDCGAFLHEVLRRDGSCRRDEAGWDALALRDRAAQRAAGAVRARAGPPRAQGGRPAHPAADADRPRGGPVRPAPARCSPRSAGCTRRCSAGRCR